MSDATVPVVLLDASALYPAALRNLLMRLTGNGLFQARWTTRTFRTNGHAPFSALARNLFLRSPAPARFWSNVLDAEVTGYESLIDHLELPDPDDRHVLAAAIYSEAALILTLI